MEELTETTNHDDLKDLKALRQKMGNSLTSLEQLRPPEGISTGLDVFDHFLIWRGLPKGDISLFSGKPGTGATSLWLHTARQVHQQGGWAAWINSDYDLMPNSLIKRGLNLKKLLVVKKPENDNQLFWILQELISSSLFELIGCQISQNKMKPHQLQKLKKLARQHRVALVFICHQLQTVVNPIYSLIVDCKRDFVTIRRALHRPTPFSFSGTLIQSEFLPSLKKTYQLLG